MKYWFTLISLALFVAVNTAVSQEGASLDERMKSLGASIPPGATEGARNGASFKSESGEIVTYNRLEQAARLVPPTDDRDVLSLLTYLRHSNPCLRYIAASALRTWQKTEPYPEIATAAMLRDESDSWRMRLTEVIVSKTLEKLEPQGRAETKN